jgi:hypothetical protein
MPTVDNNIEDQFEVGSNLQSLSLKLEKDY